MGSGAHGLSVHIQQWLRACLPRPQAISSLPSHQVSLRSSGTESLCPVLPDSGRHASRVFYWDWSAWATTWLHPLLTTDAHLGG